MAMPPEWDSVLERLEHHRALLLGRATDELTYSIPILAAPPAADAFGHHQRQLYTTVERLHDGLQAMRLDERLLVYEFEWGGQVLPRLGVTVEHLEELIDRYVSAAHGLDIWAPGEGGVLEAIRAYLRRLARATFPAGVGARPEAGP